MKFPLSLLILLFSFCVFAQEQTSNYRTIKIAVKDSIVIDSVSINSTKFILRKKDNTIIQDKTIYINTLSVKNKDFQTWNDFIKSLTKAYKKSIILEKNL